MIGGLTTNGFIAPTVEEIFADIVARVLTKVNANLDLSPDQSLGQILMILSEDAAQRWEAIATIYAAMDPDSAEGYLLRNICAITGTRPFSAKYSYVTGTLNLNAGTTVSAGSIAAVSGQPSNTWVLQADVHNAGGSPANFTGLFRSSLPGPFAANAGTLTVIQSPVVGWNSVTNAADATRGTNADTDATLRARRENELAAGGASTVDAIRSDLLEADPGIIQAFVYENTTQYIDANGLPPRSIRAVVWDGASPVSNTIIAQAIWNSKPATVLTFGAVSTTATDSQGNPQTVYFDRAAQVPIYFSLTTTPSSITSAQRDVIKAAIKAYGDTTLNLDVDVIALAFHAAALTAGVTDIPTFTLGTTPSPVGTSNIPISGLQIATVSTTNILVNGL